MLTHGQTKVRLSNIQSLFISDHQVIDFYAVFMYSPKLTTPINKNVGGTVINIKLLLLSFKQKDPVRKH